MSKKRNLCECAVVIGLTFLVASCATEIASTFGDHPTWTRFCGLFLYSSGTSRIDFEDQAQTVRGVTIFAGIFACSASIAWKRKPKAAAVAPTLAPVAKRWQLPAATSLDTPLINLSPGDPLTVRQLLNGGVVIVGRPGSAKTTGSGATLARGIVGLPKSGGCILAAKPEDAGMWREIFTSAGREKDLVVFEPGSRCRFNVLDYEMSQGAHTRNITRAIKIMGETLHQSDGKGGGEDGGFWEQQQERLIYNAVEILKCGTGRVTAPDLQKFIIGAALTREDLAMPAWKAGFHNQCLKAAFEKEKSSTETHDYQLAADYWLAEYPSMAEKTRSSVLAHVLGLLHVFNTGVVRELLSAGTTVSPDDMLRGKWVLVNMAPSEWGDIGNFVCAAWKYMTQRCVLRRGGDGNVITIWMDEAQQFVNSLDAHYMAQCRSHKGCVVALTQSKHSFYAALKGRWGEHQADVLLSCFSLKVFHALGDNETAEWASGLIGRELRTFTGASIHEEEDAYGALMGKGQVTCNFHESFEAELQPNVFMHGLRTGGPENGFLCDAIVIRSGEPFANGRNWLRVTFNQKVGAA